MANISYAYARYYKLNNIFVFSFRNSNYRVYLLSLSVNDFIFLCTQVKRVLQSYYLERRL